MAKVDLSVQSPEQASAKITEDSGSAELDEHADDDTIAMVLEYP